MKALAPLNISMLAPPDDTDYRKAVNEMLVHYGEFVSKPLKRKKLPSRADFMAMMELQSSMMIELWLSMTVCPLKWSSTNRIPKSESSLSDLKTLNS